jgi:hypothetical protein
MPFIYTPKFPVATTFAEGRAVFHFAGLSLQDKHDLAYPILLPSYSP